MKILFIGEIVASLGKAAVKAALPSVLDKYKPDLVLANIENLTNGRGISEADLHEMQALGIDYFTSGDHAFKLRETLDFIDSAPLIRPANFPPQTPGSGFAEIDLGQKGQVLLINLMGRTTFNELGETLDNPFNVVDSILEAKKDKKYAAILVDMHAEATSEKYALGFHLDGRVTAIVGTHTHVPTCDGRVLPKGTMFLSDVGMCGSLDSVIGVKKDIIIRMFLTGELQRFEWESAGTKAFRSVLFDTELKSINRIDQII